MNESELIELFEKLLEEQTEQSWLEFKLNVAQSNASVTPDGIGEYISALANGACISDKEYGYLVLGVEDKTHKKVGTSFNYRKYKIGNQDFELWLRASVTPKINFEIHELNYNEKNYVLFEIPSAKGEPVNFKNKAFIRINSQKTNLQNYPEYLRKIYNSLEDWSAKTIPDANISDLDEDALITARIKFKDKSKNESFYSQIDKWDTKTLLDKAKITKKGKITNSAILLLGKNESSHYILPYIAEITWKLDTEERAYEHYGPPFLLNTTKVLQRIRNYQYKFFPNNELLAVTVNKYENRVILEAVHNSIAHQDYLRQARIIVTEKSDKVIFQNSGNFFSGTPEEYFMGDKTPDKYRNPWLVRAMVNLGMIDTIGSGIHTMLIEQKNRYFPLPDYSKSMSEKVILEIYGHEIDVNYSKMLIENKELDLKTVILLDRVQKKLKISKEAIALLKKHKLIEGRSPNIFVSAKIAEVTDKMEEYIRNKSFDDKHFKDMIIEYLKKFGKAKRADIDKLIIPKLSEALSDKQKKFKVGNLLSALRNENRIINKGFGIWNLTN
ncbi:MAG: putative DNA binding domain-containing protein, partial [Candidatus Delongbacteria bacterium]|nr:putative DNA binding domain-containing protein [Candidatus Delongbacteria bacterium]MCG2760855.1 putative DNA binding domain-containing protein [Candidatus Delongbacteria bacterium]